MHEQVEVLFDDASGSKVRQVPLPQGGGGAAGTSRLMAMKAAFDEGGDEEEDDEWDPVQQQFQKMFGHRHRRFRSKAKVFFSRASGMLAAIPEI